MGRACLALRRSATVACGMLIMLIACGCGASSIFLSSGPAPRVEDCMIVQQATPAKFVCDGKVYTAVQLADIRNGGSAAKP